MSKLTNQKLAREFRAAALEHRWQASDRDTPPESVASHRICADVLFAVAIVYEKAADE